MEAHEYHCLPVEEFLDRYDTHLEKGLTQEEARERLQKYGPNELIEKPRPGFFKMLAAQFNNFLIVILILAAVLSLLLGEVVDALAIMVIVALNSVVGVIQESKAEAALAALKQLAAPNAQVVRGGQVQTVPGRELVPGDVVLIEAGNYVPADLRLIESYNLKIEEASLTGESVPVEKNAHIVLDRDIPLGDRRNSAFMSTIVTYGRGKGIVASSGMNTQIGQIAEMLQSHAEELTPLQQKLDQLAKVLGVVCLSICGLIFVYGLIRDTQIGRILTDGPLMYLAAEQKAIIALLMTAVSLAIAAIPEGLPAVMTICLALGMQRMIKRHALIRKLPAVETLGCATVICSDKTGTLTQNEMTVVQAWAGGKRVRITGEGYQPEGRFFLGEEIDPAKYPDLSMLLHAGLLCNDAGLQESGEEHGSKTYRIVGDPTEGALVVMAAKGGLWREPAEAMLPRVQEIPFDSERKRMSTIHSVPSDSALPFAFTSPEIAFVKGAPDMVLDLCTGILVDGQTIPLDAAMKAEILEANREMASQALRVLGAACRPLDGVPSDCTSQKVERELIFLGLTGMIDPARPEVKKAVQVARTAGLKSVMVTGDYKDTAEAIAREIGILTPGGRVLTGAELERMSIGELSAIADRVEVCCRVSPAHKTKIVDAFKESGHIVAMTGDGVNDAPALKRANIGIAMGITGTDVSKETADMVLTDDNYSSIVAAIEEGRIIYSNIRKFVYYLISCNISEILIIFASMMAGLPMALKPVQLLMMNLVTDGAPALALGMEKGEPGIMNRPPRPAREPVINRQMQMGMLVISGMMAASVLAVYYWALRMYPSHVEHAQTMAYASLCMTQLCVAFTARSEYHSLWSIGPFSNRWMVWAVAGSTVLVFLTIYVPFLQPVFDTVPLTLGDWIMIVPFMLVASVTAELTKLYLRRKAASHGNGGAHA